MVRNDTDELDPEHFQYFELGVCSQGLLFLDVFRLSLFVCYLGIFGVVGDLPSLLSVIVLLCLFCLILSF